MNLSFPTLGSPIPHRLPGPDADVIECWGKAVGDPDGAEILPRWLRQGAPIGMLEHIDTANISPAVEPTDPVRHPDTLFSELAGWSNYSSAEDEPDVVNGLLDAQAAKGHCKFFDDITSLEQYLGVDHVVLAKLALITKYKADALRSTALFGIFCDQTSIPQSPCRSASFSPECRTPWTTPGISGSTAAMIWNGWCSTSPTRSTMYLCAPPREDSPAARSAIGLLCLKFYGWGEIGPQHLGQVCSLAWQNAGVCIFPPCLPGRDLR